MRMINYILATLLLLVVWSCRTTEYVPVEVIKSDTTYINKVQRDSIYQLDSVYILDRGDTVLITKTKYLYRDKLVRDTVYMSKTDSIQVPYPVERKLTKWEQFRLDVGGWAIVTVIIIILIVVGWRIYRLYK
jgi:hypothetical protein